MSNRTDPDRRDFVKTAAAGLLILKPATVFGSQANSAVEVGLIGCGGRGNWLAPFFPEYTGARIVALADVVQGAPRLDRKTFKVDSSRAYYGPEAYKELAHSKLDAVIIETPPYLSTRCTPRRPSRPGSTSSAPSPSPWMCRDAKASRPAANRRRRRT